MKIALVDDDSAVLDLLAQLITQQLVIMGDPNHRIDTYTSGEASEWSIHLTLDNTFDGPLKQTKSGQYLTTKTDGSGLGLQSVHTITDQYNSFLEIEQRENMFCVSIALNRTGGTSDL